MELVLLSAPYVITILVWLALFGFAIDIKESKKSYVFKFCFAPFAAALKVGMIIDLLLMRLYR